MCLEKEKYDFRLPLVAFQRLSRSSPIADVIFVTTLSQAVEWWVQPQDLLALRWKAINPTTNRPREIAPIVEVTGLKGILRKKKRCKK